MRCNRTNRARPLGRRAAGAGFAVDVGQLPAQTTPWNTGSQPDVSVPHPYPMN